MTILRRVGVILGTVFTWYFAIWFVLVYSVKLYDQVSKGSLVKFSEYTFTSWLIALPVWVIIIVSSVFGLYLVGAIAVCATQELFSKYWGHGKKQ